jgi:hypothetical protein
MTQASRYLAALLLAAGATAALPAIAQFAPETAQPEATQQQPEAAKPKRSASATTRSGPDVSGNWAGELTQVGSTTPYKFELKLTGQGLETKYPDLNCTGKLTRIGSSKSYVFYVEIITSGQVDKGGRCPDGTITVARSADKLAVGWFGSIKENTIIAYGTLAKK